MTRLDADTGDLFAQPAVPQANLSSSSSGTSPALIGPTMPDVPGIERAIRRPPPLLTPSSQPLPGPPATFCTNTTCPPKKVRPPPL